MRLNYQDAMKRGVGVGVGGVWPFNLISSSKVIIQQNQNQNQNQNLPLSSIHKLSIPPLTPSLSRSSSSHSRRGIRGTATSNLTERMGMMEEHNTNSNNDNNSNNNNTSKQDHHHHRQYQLLLTKQDEQVEKEEESAGGGEASASASASASSSPGVLKKESIGVKFKPEVGKLQQLVKSSGDGWDKTWVRGLTPWDLGRPTPLLLHLLHTHSLPTGRALVPGCGSGHDVVAMACPDRFVVGLDISGNAIRKAKQLSSSSENANCFTFLEADFFSWHPLELFDLVFDYTFFCALEPELRPAWARKIQDVLKHDGELITLMFPIDDHDGGPPFKVSVSDYEEVLRPIGFKAVSISDNELAVKARKGREKLGRWKRCPRQSLL